MARFSRTIGKRKYCLNQNGDESEIIRFRLDFSFDSMLKISPADRESAQRFFLKTFRDQRTTRCPHPVSENARFVSRVAKVVFKAPNLEMTCLYICRIRILLVLPSHFLTFYNKSFYRVKLNTVVPTRNFRGSG